jgi:hypothetical protein
MSAKISPGGRSRGLKSLGVAGTDKENGRQITGFYKDFMRRLPGFSWNENM